MPRVLAWFLGGLAGGTVGVYVACAVGVAFAYEYIDPPAFRQARNAEEYARRVRELTASGIMQVSVYGGLLCAGLCAMRAAEVFPSGLRRRSPRKTVDLTQEPPLTSAEFRQTVQACLFLDLRRRTPEFVQGLLVGRLVEGSPELAAKIEKFGNEHMAALLQDLLIAGGKT